MNGYDRIAVIMHREISVTSVEMRARKEMDQFRISELLDHSLIEITCGIYIHVIDYLKEIILETLDLD